MNEDAIIATNSSTLLPSTFVQYTGRPDKFVSLHFANHICSENLVEIMKQPDTTGETLEQVRNFALDIRMVPVMVHKEQPGYLLNSMLVPWLNSALLLWGNAVGSVEDIDRAWMIAKETKYGPFGNMDRVRLNTVYNIMNKNLQNMSNGSDKEALAVALNLINDMIKQGVIGIESGKGFAPVSINGT